MSDTSNNAQRLAEAVAQRFRPYATGEVRLNAKGTYVRWDDYDRIRRALSHLLSHWDETQKRFDLCGIVLDEARESLTPSDWQKVFDHPQGDHGELCTCYGMEGDNSHCPYHGVGKGFPQ